MLMHTCQYLLPLMVLVTSFPFFSNGNSVDSFMNMEEKTNCILIPRTPAIDKQEIEVIDNNSRLVTFNINISGALGPLSEQYPGGLFNKQQWILVTEKAGKTLLLFPDDYVTRSFYTLSFRTQSVEMNLDQRPEHCFSQNYTLDQILNTIRWYVLRNISKSVGDKIKTMEICNRQIFITDDHKAANLSYLCCKGADGMCYILKPDIWLNILDYFRICLTIFVIATCPYLCLPKFSRLSKLCLSYRYIAADNEFTDVVMHKYSRSETIPNIPERPYMKINSDRSGEKFKKFESYVNDLSCGTHLLRIKRIVISVLEEEKLIKVGSCPVGVLQFLYKTFIKCEMETKPVVNTSCRTNLFKKCSKMPKVPVSSCVKLFSFILFFIIISSPCWIIMIYIRQQLTNLSVVSTIPAEDQYEGISINNIFTIDYYLNQISYFASYIGLVVGFFTLGLIIYSYKFRNIIWAVGTFLIYGDETLESVVSDFLSTVIKPLQKFGIIGFLLIPFVAVLAFLLAICKTCHPFNIFYNLVKITRNKKYKMFDCFEIAYLVVYILLTICMCAVISICIAFYSACFTFFTIGLLLNYNDILRYYVLISFLITYGFSCIHNVHECYNNFLQLLKEKVQTKIANQFETYKLKPKSSTTNGLAFSITGQCKNDLHGYGGDLFWKARLLVLFINTSRKIPSLRLSKKFFQYMNKSDNLACPGPEYIVYLKALRDFILVTIFLFFVLVVLFALGNAYNLSPGVQTLVALGSGFLPFVLKKIVFKSNTSEITPNDNSIWDKMLEWDMDNYAEMFIVKDIVFDTVSRTQEPGNTYDFFVKDTGNAWPDIYWRKYTGNRSAEVTV